MKNLYLLLIMFILSSVTYPEEEYSAKLKILKEVGTYKTSSFYTTEEKDYIASLKGKTFTFVENKTTQLINYDSKFRRIGINSLIYDLLSSYYEVNVELRKANSFRSAYEEVKNNSADALMGITHNKNREKYLAFSNPIYPEKGGLFTIADELNNIKNIYILKSSVWNDNVDVDEFNSFIFLTDVNIIEVDEFDHKVLLDPENAIFSSEFALQSFVKSNIKGLRFTPLISSYISIGFSNHIDAEFIKIINKGLFKLFGNHLSEYMNFIQDQQKEKLFLLNLTTEEEEYLKANKDIKVLLQSDYFPEIFYDDKTQSFNGSYYDILSQFAKLTGLRIDIINSPHTPWKELIEDFNNKNGDMLLLINHHQERVDKYIHSKNIFKEKLVLIGLKGSPVYTTNPIDYIGSPMGILLDDVGNIILNNYLNLSREQVIEYDNFPKMIGALYNKKINYAIMPLGVFKYHKMYKQRDRLKVVASFYEIDLNVAFNEEHEILKSIFNKSLMTNSLKTDTFHNKWESYTSDFEGIISEKNAIIERDLKGKKKLLQYLIALSFLMFILIIFIFYMYRRLQKVNIKLNRDMNFDHLLDVPNQNYFEDDQNKIILRSNQIVACISIANKKELDQIKSFDELKAINFKIVNSLKDDRYSKAINKIYSFNSIFVIIMTIPDNIEETLYKLKNDIKEKLDKSITILISYSHNELNNETLKTLFERAYFAINNPMKKELILRASLNTIESQKEKIFLAGDLLRAIDEGEISPFFQPKIDSHTFEVCGAEALCRWLHPTLGTIAPARYIELAEENGNILKLDLKVAEKSIKTLSKWLEKKIVKEDFKLAFNLSMVTIESFNIHMKIVELASRYGVAPSNLEIEITENLLSEDIEKVADVLFKLKKLGFSIAIDDFSAGNASLSHLLSLEVDTLKIDRSLIKSLDESDRKGLDVYKSIVDIGKKVKVKTVVEGIETKVQLDLILNVDIDMIQGFYFSKPLPKEEFEKYLKEFKGASDKNKSNAVNNHSLEV